MSDEKRRMSDEKRRQIAAALGPLPPDVWNCNVVQDARWRRVDAIYYGINCDKAEADEADWIAEVRRQAARREARCE